MIMVLALQTLSDPEVGSQAFDGSQFNVSSWSHCCAGSTNSYSNCCQ
jgi:hypothetical protein